MSRLGGLFQRHTGAIIFFTALTVRLVYYAQASEHDLLFALPILDERTYHEMALQLLDKGPAYDGRPFWQEPLYPYVLAGLYRAVGPSIAIAKLCNALFGSLSAALLYRVGRKLVAERVAAGAGFALAFYGTAIFCDGQLLSGSLVMLLHLVLVASTLRMLAAPSRTRALALGLVGGIAILAKANGVVVLLALALVFARRCGWRALVPLALGCLIGLAPCTIRNRVASGEWVVVSSNGGFNLYLGNNEDALHTERLRPGTEMDALVNEPVRLGYTEAAAQSRYFIDKTLAFCRSHPFAELRLLARKAAQYLWGEEIPRNQQIDPARLASPMFSALYWRWLIAFPAGLVFPLALAGLWVRARQRNDEARDILLPVVFLIAEASSVVPLFVTERYRLPAVPLFVLFAVDFIAASWMVRKDRRALAFRAALAAALLVLCNLRLDPMRGTYDADTYFNAAVQLQAAERWRDADDLYLHALEEDPRFGLASAGRAMIAWHEGRSDDAARQFEAALREDRSSDLLRHAAQFYAERGDAVRAEALHREAGVVR